MRLMLRNKTKYFLLSLRKNDNDCAGQAGNVFVVIMLGVFLFGSLMYMFSRNAQQGTGNLTKQQSRIAAQEILNYARLVEGAVDRVRRNGCSETEISFENDVVTGYENPNAPPDRSCHIFEPEGGQLSWSSPPLTDIAEEYLFNGAHTAGVGSFCTGSKCTELLLFYHNIPLNICDSLNQLMQNNSFIASPPIQHDLHYLGKFNGNFNRLEGIEDSIGGSLTELENIETACVAEHDSSGYFFYHVLLAR